MPISSRALGKIREGSETRDTKVSPEHPPLMIKISDDIVRSSWKHEKNGLPYPGIEQADGISFSCSFEKKALPSLRYILDAVNRTVYNGELESTDIDLKRWSNQGILMINSAFTCTIGKPGSHTELWKPMMAYLLDYLNSYNPGLTYVFLGKKAEENSIHLGDNCNKLFVSHPASAAYSHLKEWDCKDVFNNVSDLTKKSYNFDIKW